MEVSAIPTDYDISRQASPAPTHAHFEPLLYHHNASQWPLQKEARRGAGGAGPWAEYVGDSSFLLAG